MRFDLDMPAWKWPFYVARHPFEGFEDLRWKKAYNTKVAMVIVLCFFIITVCQQVMTGFLFNTSYVKVFNIVPLLVQTIILLRLAGAEDSVPALFFRYAFYPDIVFFKCRQNFVKSFSNDA